MALKKPAKNAHGTKISGKDERFSEDALLEWRLTALKLESKNIRFEDSESYSREERLEMIERGAAAIGSYVDQIKREVHDPLPEAEIYSNYLAMKNLHLVARDGFVALYWLAADLMRDEDRLDAKVRSALARSAVASKLRNDPKHAEMHKVREEWLRWKDGQVNYKNDADFARKMMQLSNHLESEGSIKNAVARWRKKSSS